ncbi:hypothetical protein KFS98_003677 [Salmonella enterica]|nr:hypothetical protein [Salmonella enterica]
MGIIRLQPEVVVSELPIFIKEFSDETLIENFESELNSTQYSISLAGAEVSDVKDFDAGNSDAERNSSDPMDVSGSSLTAAEPEGSNDFLKGPTANGPDVVWESADFLDVYRLKGLTVRIDPAYRFSPDVNVARDSFESNSPDYASNNDLAEFSVFNVDPAIKTRSLSLTEPELLYTWIAAANAQYQDKSQLMSNSVVIINPPVITRPATAEEAAGLAQYKFEKLPVQFPLIQDELRVQGSTYHDIVIKSHTFKVFSIKESYGDFQSENSLSAASLGNLAIFTDVNIVTVTYPKQVTLEAKDTSGYRENLTMAFQAGTVNFHDIRVLVIDNAKMRNFQILEGTQSGDREASFDPNQPMKTTFTPDLINIRVLAKKYFDAFQVLERVDPDKENLIVTQSKAGVIVSADEVLLRTSSDANRIRPPIVEGYADGDRLNIPTADALKTTKVEVKPLIKTKRLTDWLTLKERTSKDAYREKWQEEHWSGAINKLDNAGRSIVNLISPVLTDTEFKYRRRGVTLPLGIMTGTVENCTYQEKPTVLPLYLTLPDDKVPGVIFEISSTSPPKSSQYWF